MYRTEMREMYWIALSKRMACVITYIVITQAIEHC